MVKNLSNFRLIFRNEFLSSKLNGNINFEDDFYFDLTSRYKPGESEKTFSIL